MSLPDDVLSQFPAAAGGAIQPLGNHGGFSGARLFRVEAPAGAFCLRAWPADMRSDVIQRIHELMADAVKRGLDFVPRALLTRRGKRQVSAGNRWWDLTTWMSGSASFWHEPSLPRLQAACVALARLHRAWEHAERPPDRLDSIQRHLKVLFDWSPQIRSNWRPPADPADPVAPWAERAWALVQLGLPRLPGIFLGWVERKMRRQPVLCDIWHDHVLFIGDRVTGVVDYGSCKIDSIAVDLARLLGSLVGDDRTMWAAGFDAYTQVRRLSAEECAFADALDRSGVIVAAANWLRWLYVERRVYPDRNAVARRVAALVARLERG